MNQDQNNVNNGVNGTTPGMMSFVSGTENVPAQEVSAQPVAATPVAPVEVVQAIPQPVVTSVSPVLPEQPVVSNEPVQAIPEPVAPTEPVVTSVSPVLPEQPVVNNEPVQPVQSVNGLNTLPPVTPTVGTDMNSVPPVNNEPAPKEKKKLSPVLIILIIGILTVIGVFLGIFLFEKFGKKGDTEGSSEVVNQPSEVNYKIESLTNAQIDLFWNETMYDVSVVDGNLKVGDKTFTITDETIKYFYYQRYQESKSTVFHFLTNNGNIYVKELTSDANVDTFNEYIKLDYTNVTDIVVIPNDHYGQVFGEDSGMTDNRETYLYALVNGETQKLDYQYNY